MIRLFVNNYSKRSFVVRGNDTKKYNGDLIKLKGKWKTDLLGGPGFLFSNKHFDKVQEFIEEKITLSKLNEEPSKTEIVDGLLLPIEVQQQVISLTKHLPSDRTMLIFLFNLILISCLYSYYNLEEVIMVSLFGLKCIGLYLCNALIVFPFLALTGYVL